MNNANEITHHTKLYGFIGVDAGVSSISATTNKLFKLKLKDAMMIPLNIREDDFYFTLTNMKKSHVNGALISKEFSTEVVELLDDSSDIVKKSGMCDVVKKNDGKLFGDVLTLRALGSFLSKNGAKKVALLGVSSYAKAFVLSSSLEVSFFHDSVEELMAFTQELNVLNPDINRIADEMSLDLSSFDAVVDFSEFSELNMIKSLPDFNLDMKIKKEFSPLKIRALELEKKYVGFEDILDEVASEVYSYFDADISSKHEMKF
jgi:shikimate 5-dehydrogenase